MMIKYQTISINIQEQINKKENYIYHRKSKSANLQKIYETIAANVSNFNMKLVYININFYRSTNLYSFTSI
jgi:hypothetical protein